MKKETKKHSKAAVNSKTGKLVAAASAMLIALGAAGVFIFSGNSIQMTDEKETTTQSETQTTTVTTTAQDTYTTKEQIQWRKAGIGEYDVAKASQTTTVTTTTSASTTSAPQSQSTTAAQTTAQSAAATTTTAAATTTTAAATTTTKATTQATTTAKPAATTTKATTKAAVTTKAPAVKTVYNSSKISYTAEEFDMLCYVVQAEAGNCPEYYKIAIANVVINRVKSPRFAYAKNIKAVLTASNQFTAITNYYTKARKPNQSTINCCKRALNGEDNSNGAVYYYSPGYVGASVAAWFESMKLCVAFDSARFFKPW